jgi:lactate dehydrogenase-like 2-hydroxyacid dehydrogenase
MSEQDQPAILLAPGLGGLRRLFEPLGEVLDLPADDLSAFAAGPGQAVRALVTTGSSMVPPQIAALPRLGLVAVIGSGFEEIDVKGLRARGVEVTHSPNANHEDVADHAVGLMLMQVRKLGEGERRIRAGAWLKDRHPPPTRSIRTLKVGIVGLGAIGLAIAERLKGFGCEIAWWGPREKPGVAIPRATSLMALAQDSDVLMLAHRADDGNKGLIDRAVIEAVGPRGVIVNITRGSAIEEDALIAALKDGRLGGAALDVFEHEPTSSERWRDVPNATLTPHTAGGGDASLRAMTGMVLENVRRHLAGQPVANPVPALAD